MFASYLHSPQLVLGLFPEWFAPVQPDWPRNTHLSGFILQDDGGQAEAHAQADQFLDGGPAPVLVTPGSAATDRTRFFAHLVEACRAVGARAMLVTNHPAQLPRTLPPGIQAFPYLPFSRVMPRCAAAVYHGGIGTLAQAVRAGVPHLVVANAHDQPDNGQRIERLGLGLTLDEHRLARALRRAPLRISSPPRIPAGGAGSSRRGLTPRRPASRRVPGSRRSLSTAGLGANDARVQVLDDQLLHRRKEKVTHEGLADRLIERGHVDLAGLQRLVS